MRITLTNIKKIVLLVFISLFILLGINTTNAMTRENIITTDFGYDCTISANPVAILGDWSGTTSGEYFNASSNQTLNNTLYSSAKCLKMTNGDNISYAISDDNIKYVELTIYGLCNSASATASYVLSAYSSSNVLLGSSNSVNIATVESSMKGGYASINSKVLEATSAFLSIATDSAIKYIKLTITVSPSSANTVLSRIILSYDVELTPTEEFASYQTQTSLKMNYTTTGEGDETSYNISSSTAIRFGTTIPKELYDKIISQDENAEFGVLVEKDEVLEDNLLVYTNAEIKENIIPIRVASAGASVENLSGDFYQFALVLSGIPESDYDTLLRARCYVKINSDYYYMKETNYSLASLATKYVDNYNNNVNGYDDCSSHLGVLSHLSSFQAEVPSVFVYYLDLIGGPGDCALIKTGNIDILVDAGKDDSESEANVTAFLNEKVTDNIIEYVVVTHPHDDHYGGLPNVFTNFEVETLFKYSIIINEPTASLTDFEQSIITEGCNVNSIFTYLNGDTTKELVITENVSLMFYDTTYLTSTDVNGSSIVFCLEAFDTRILFSGDAEKSQESVYSRLCGNVDIYSMGHHGSANATSSEALYYLDPEVVIAQIGDKLGNEYKHPTYVAMSRVYDYDELINIYATAGDVDDNGSYTLNSNGTITIAITSYNYQVISEYNNGTPYEMRVTDYWNSDDNLYK